MEERILAQWEAPSWRPAVCKFFSYVGGVKISEEIREYHVIPDDRLKLLVIARIFKKQQQLGIIHAPRCHA
jgi:hypothetical protein